MQNMQNTIETNEFDKLVIYSQISKWEMLINWLSQKETDTKVKETTDYILKRFNFLIK